MGNLINKLFKGSSKGCCDVKIEEVKTEASTKEQSNGNKTDKNSTCCKEE